MIPLLCSELKIMREQLAEMKRMNEAVLKNLASQKMQISNQVGSLSEKQMCLAEGLYINQPNLPSGMNAELA
ncbi:hypothetical protein Ciccas_010161 [Cichlidogyrus casuarinus]|uniref:Uncharacterized protein n=1 Tax=Cichlidogyrus casuarinus TaxID=1844966 RepID=A0ABD2PXS4_9PLAT